MRDEITQDYLKSKLIYDPDTGIFTNRVRRGPRMPGLEAGCWHSQGYRVINILGKFEFAHRLAWVYVYGKHPRKYIDHINRNRADNRISNLREADMFHNAQNADPQAKKSMRKMTSKYMGVHWSKQAKKWSVGIGAYGKRMHIGLFVDEEEAAKAYLEAKKKYHIPVLETIEELRNEN